VFGVFGSKESWSISIDTSPREVMFCKRGKEPSCYLSALSWWCAAQVVMLERDNLPFLPSHSGATSSAVQDVPTSSAHHSSHHLPDLASVMEARRGVPQFKQPHVLLGRGLQELETLFPGFK
jgi:hypothetical protein